MQIRVTDHAIIRYHERFVNTKYIDGNQIAEEIEFEFSEAVFDSDTNDGARIYKGKNIYFIVKDDFENNERIIITIYPINNEVKINKPKITTRQEERIFFEESRDIKIYKQVLNGILPKFPQRFWEDDKGGNLQISARECTRYMYEELLKWDMVDIINKSTEDIFKKYKLTGMINVLFNQSWHIAIFNAYPNIKPYMIKKRGHIEEYWKVDGIQRAKEMGVWLKKELEHQGYKFSGRGVLSLKWSKIFREYKLSSMLKIVFDNDLVKFFNIVFDAGVDDVDIARYNIELEKKKYVGLQM